MEVFGSSGTRGVANVDLTPAFAVRVATAAGTVWGADRVAVGRDTRTSGRMLEAAVVSGLESTGADVDRVGVVPTPALQAYADREHVPALMITASHNPPEYNGIKLVGPDGTELSAADLAEVEETLVDEAFEAAAWDAVGTDRHVEGVNRAYVDGLLDAVDVERIAAADLTVALDPGHGAGSSTSPEFFRRLGCHVVTVNAHPDGRFPGRDPEPVAPNLDGLQRLVRAADADVGVAHDGDADRAVFVDETGGLIEGDAALAALAAAELSAGDVAVSAVNASRRLVDVVESMGARLELTRIGSTHLLTRIRELQSQGEHVPIAGEGNGGIIFPSYRAARDGAYTAARFLELVVDEPASAVVAPHEGYHNVRRRVHYEGETEREALLAAAERFAEGADGEVSTVDGYRVDHDDAWVLVRASGTEPLVRIYAEADTSERAESLADRAQQALDAAA